MDAKDRNTVSNATGTTIPQAKRAKFLERLAEGYSVKDACRAANVARSTVYALREHDDWFRDAWRQANDEGVEVLEDEARRRAVDGVDRLKMVGDGQVIETHYSDTLLIFLLKAKRPGVYRDHYRHEFVGADGGPIVIREEIDTRPVLKVLADVGLLTRAEAAANGAGDAAGDEVHPA